MAYKFIPIQTGISSIWATRVRRDHQVRADLTQRNLRPSWMTEYRLNRLSPDSYSKLMDVLTLCNVHTPLGDRILRVPALAELERRVGDIPIDRISAHALSRGGEDFFDLRRIKELKKEIVQTSASVRARMEEGEVQRLVDKICKIDAAKQAIVAQGLNSGTRLKDVTSIIASKLKDMGFSEVINVRDSSVANQGNEKAMSPDRRKAQGRGRGRKLQTKSFRIMSIDGPIKKNPVILAERLTISTTCSFGNLRNLEVVNINDEAQPRNTQGRLRVEDLFNTATLRTTYGRGDVFVGKIDRQKGHIIFVFHCQRLAESPEGMDFLTGNEDVDKILIDKLKDLFVTASLVTKAVESREARARTGQTSERALSNKPEQEPGKRFTDTSREHRIGPLAFECVTEPLRNIGEHGAVADAVVRDAKHVTQASIDSDLPDAELFEHTIRVKSLFMVRDTSKSHPQFEAGWLPAAFAAANSLDNIEDGGRYVNVTYFYATMVGRDYRRHGLMTFLNYQMLMSVVEDSGGWVKLFMLSLTGQGLPFVTTTQSLAVNNVLNKFMSTTHNVGRAPTGRARRRLLAICQRQGWQANDQFVVQGHYDGARTETSQRIPGLGERDMFIKYSELTFLNLLKLWLYIELVTKRKISKMQHETSTQ